jgi:hypothetical protein|tara:strand:+ start:591 stop:947 length:357 start_codon:yes stop_codon:yes gene_type:complete
MKQLILIFTLFIGLNVTGQTQPYQEFAKINELGYGLEKVVEAGQSVWFLTDNNDPNNVHTYIMQMTIDTGSPMQPIVPNSNWNSFQFLHLEKTIYTIPISEETFYVLDSNFSPYVKIN